MGFAEYDQYDGVGLGELVNRGQVSPQELVAEALSRIDAVNPRINAVVHLLREHVERRCRETVGAGPFAGVPFVLKDLLAKLAGEPMQSGSRMYRDYVPDHNSALVDRFLRSGVIVVGKSNTPELGITPTTEAELYGPCRNPWSLEHTSGGSSGGAAAAVAAGIVPLASAGDGGGSIRIPASCCGIFGIKPSRGRTPQGPDETNLWASGVCEHVVSRSVRDSAAMLDQVSGADAGAPYSLPSPSRPFVEELQRDPRRLRIAYSAEPYLTTSVHPECERALEDAVELLRELGHELVEARADIDGLEFGRCFLLMLTAEVYASVRDAERDMGRRARSGDFEHTTELLAMLARTFDAGELCEIQRSLYRMGRKFAAFIESFDVVLSPTLALPPVQIGELSHGSLERMGHRLVSALRPLGAGRLFHKLDGPRKAAMETFAFAGYTPLHNVSGNPAMSVPLYWTAQGLPIGVMFASRLGDEATLFALAGQLERARPWASRRPPVWSGVSAAR